MLNISYVIPGAQLRLLEGVGQGLSVVVLDRIVPGPLVTLFVGKAAGLLVMV